MTKKIKSINIGQKCHICGSEITAILFNVDGELLVCEVCDCVSESDKYPTRLSTFTLDEYNAELKKRILSARKINICLKKIK